jgi:hypothetical protein
LCSFWFVCHSLVVFFSDCHFVQQQERERQKELERQQRLERQAAIYKDRDFQQENKERQLQIYRQQQQESSGELSVGSSPSVDRKSTGGLTPSARAFGRSFNKQLDDEETAAMYFLAYITHYHTITHNEQKEIVISFVWREKRERKRKKGDWSFVCGIGIVRLFTKPKNIFIENASFSARAENVRGFEKLRYLS